MASDSPDDPAALLARLQRAAGALSTEPAAAPPTAERAKGNARTWGGGGMALSVALVAAAIATGRYWLIVPALLVGIAAGLLLLESLGQAVLDPSRAQVGIGATVRRGARLEPGSRVGAGASVGANAHLEPGAVVGMGASVGKGAVLRREAWVRTGASVGADVVLEARAVVGTGASVGRGAVVAEGARVGVGATVGRGAYVPPGAHVPTGSTWTNTDRSAAPVQPPEAPRGEAAADPRAARIDAGCARLEAEIQQAPPQVREYLGASLGTVRALRETCQGLLRRERTLRAESSAEAMAELEEGREALQKRLDAATDEHVRSSLASALAAVEEQKRQRALMARTADRLDAELTRLLWTVDGMGTQLVRLRTAGAEVGAAPGQEVARSVKQLQDEIGAIADALEEIADAQRAEMSPVSEIEGGTPGPDGRRERDRG